MELEAKAPATNEEGKKSDTKCGGTGKVLAWPKKGIAAAESFSDVQLVIDFEQAVVETLLSGFASFLKSLSAEAEA